METLGQSILVWIVQAMMLFGGNDLNKWRATMDLFSPTTKQWMVAGEMPTQRGSGAAAAVPGHIYLVGGGIGPNWNRHCMRFDLASNEWYQVNTCGQQINCRVNCTPRCQMKVCIYAKKWEHCLIVQVDTTFSWLRTCCFCLLSNNVDVVPNVT